jgi:hypothetical protein
MSLDIDVALAEWPKFTEERCETPAGMRIKIDTLYDGQHYGIARYIDAAILRSHRLGREDVIRHERERMLWSIQEHITGMSREELEKLDRGTRPWIDFEGMESS